MDDEVKDRIEAEEGRLAKAELIMLSRALKEIKQEALDQIVASNPDHLRFRERMIITVQMMDAIKEILERFVDAGQAAQARALLAEHDLLRR